MPLKKKSSAKGRGGSPLVSPSKITKATARPVVKTKSKLRRITQGLKDFFTSLEDGLDGNRISPRPSYPDADRFDATTSEMVEAVDQLNEVLSSSHAVIKEKDQASGSRDSVVSEHFNYSVKTNPISSSPTRLSQSSQQSSPSSIPRARNIAFESRLRSQSMHDLLQQDRDIHQLQENIAGLRDWWAANKAEWRQKREEVRNIEAGIRSLELMHYRRATVVLENENAPANEVHAMEQIHERTMRQVAVQHKEIQKRLEWFLKTEFLMKAVRAKFQEMRVSIERIEAGPQIPDSDLDVPADFNYDFITQGSYKGGFDYLLTGTVVRTEWWQNKGFEWWAGFAARELESVEEEYRLAATDIQKSIDFYTGEIFTGKQAIGVLHGQIQALNFPITVDFRTPSQGVTRAFSVIETDDEKAELNGMISEIEDSNFAFERHLIIAKGHSIALQSQQSRTKAITTILSHARQRAFHSLVLPPSEHVLALVHTLVCLRWSRNARAKVWRALWDEEDNLLEDKEKMMESLVGHLSTAIMTQNDKLYNAAAAESSSSTSMLTKVILAYAKELEVLDGLLDEMSIENTQRKANRSDSGNEEWQIRINLGEDSARPSSSISSIEPGTPISWGSIIDLSHALSILNSHAPWNPRKTILDSLTELFLSPDVSHIFANALWTTTVAAFIEHMNLIVQPFLTFQMIEAFLVYSNAVEELFSTDFATQIISRRSAGWELVNEQRILGPPRRLKFAEPPGIRDAENHLIANQQAFFEGHAWRIVGDRFLRVWNRYAPQHRQVDEATLEGFLSYWHSTGRFITMCVPPSFSLLPSALYLCIYLIMLLTFLSLIQRFQTPKLQHQRHGHLQTEKRLSSLAPAPPSHSIPTLLFRSPL